MVVYLPHILVVLLLILTLIKPKWAILVYIGSLGWIPVGLAQNIYGNLDFEDITLFVAALAGLIVIVLSPKRCWTTFTKIALAYWLFSVVGNLVGLTKNPYVFDAVCRQMSKDFSLLLLFVALSGCLQDVAYFRKTVAAILIATIGVVVSVYIGRFFPDVAIIHYWAIRTYTVVDRSAGMFVNTYLAGVYIAVGISIFVAQYFFVRSSFQWKKPLLIGMSLVYGIAILYGQSRASYLTVAIVILMGSLSRVRNVIWGTLLVGVICIAILTNPILLEKAIGRFEGVDVSSLGGRVDSWRIWLGSMDDIGFILGNGFQYSALRSGIGGHSSYLEAYTDGGILGLIAFLAFWPAVLRARKRIMTSFLSDSDKANGLAFCWCAVGLLVSSAMIGLLTDTYYRTIFMTVLTVALSPCLVAACRMPQKIAWRSPVMLRKATQ